MLEQLAPAWEVRWVVAGDAAERFDETKKLSVQFGPALPAWSMDGKRRTKLGQYGEAYRAASIRKPDPSLDETESEPSTNRRAEALNDPIGLPQLNAAEGKRIDWIELAQRRGPSLRLETGSLEQLFEVLNSCSTDLARTWGIDIEAHQRLARAPKPKNLRLVAKAIHAHYPGFAERTGKQADLSLRIMVDDQGRVSDCIVTEVSSAKAFDDRACREFVERADFEPAVLIDGTPIASFYMTKVLYRLN